MDDMLSIVEYNLRQFHGKYPIDITDQVFLAIERTQYQLRIYQAAVRESNQAVVNKRIGKLVKQLTELDNLGRCNTPRSRLIQSYEKHG